MFQVVDFLKGLTEFGAAFLLLLGIIWIIYGLYEATRRKSFLKKQVEDWDFPITKFLKVLTLSGFVVGILCVIVGTGSLILNLPPSKLYGIETANSRNLFTSVLLIILGVITFLKPINDLPIASMIGLLVSTLACILIAWAIPDSAVRAIEGYINPKIVLIVIFLIIFAIVAITVKFWMSFWMGLSKLFSWPPLAAIIAIFCITQSTFLIVVGRSIIF
jgi:hypothetical protein